MEFTNKENVHKVLVHAEVSLIPVGSRGQEADTGMSKEIAVAFDAISKVDGLKTILTPMGTLIESENLSNIFIIRNIQNSRNTSGLGSFNMQHLFETR